jgi:hypothetical protein
MWRARRTLVGLAAGLLAIGLGVGLGFGAGLVPAIVAVLVVAAAGTLVGVLLWRRYGAWGYAEREDDLLVRRGVMVKRLTVVPYGRMQFVDVTAGPIDRMFGLMTVQLHTAAAATDARIPGLAVAEAERLRDHLATLGEAKATGL